MAQQKLAKQLKLNTNNESFMRYGNPAKGAYGSPVNMTTTSAK